MAVCHEWWEVFASMCKAAWKGGALTGKNSCGYSGINTPWGSSMLPSGGARSCGPKCGLAMNMYGYVAKWATLARCSCFRLEGSHVQHKRMPRNNGGVSLLHDKLGLQCVVDNHTLEDNLRKAGWDLLSKAVTTQRGYKRRCRDGTGARREGRGTAAMVERIVQGALRQRAQKS